MKINNLALAAGFVFLFFSCNAEAPDVDVPEVEAPDVAITVESSISNATLTLSGTATVPDGALIAYEVKKVPLEAPWEAFADGTAEVKDGNWVAMIELAKFPRGEIEIWVAFQTVTKRAQPQFVLDTYGELGEKMKGPQVAQSGALKRAEITKIIKY